MKAKNSSQPTYSLAAWPGLRIALTYMLGIFLGSLLPVNNMVLWFVITSCVGMYWLLDHRSRRRPNATISLGLLVCYHVILLFFGMARLHGTDRAMESDPTTLETSALIGEDLHARGLVKQVRERSSSTTVWLRIYQLEYEGQVIRKRAFDALVRWDAEEPTPTIADDIAVDIHLREATGKRNPYEFDYAAWLSTQDITWLGSVSRLSENFGMSTTYTWLPWRRMLDDWVRRGFGPEQIPIAKALLLGQKGDIEIEERQAFARSGLSHLMAVSGLHVGFIIMPLWLLIPLIWVKPIGRHLGFAMVLIILFFYSGITGFSASVVRASVMAGVSAYAKVYRHPRDPMNLLGLAAFIILLFDPRSMWDLGFQLSFCAVAILLWVMPAIQAWLPERLQEKPWSWLSGLILVSIVVQIGLYPILAIGFGEYSVAGAISNIVGIPLTQVVILWSLFALPISAMIPDYASLLLWPADRAAALLRLTAAQVSGWDWAWWYVAVPNPWIIGVWVSGAVFIAVWHRRLLRWKALGLLLVSMLIWGGTSLWDDWNRPALECLFLDVGQGDAALIRTHDHTYWLIDTGVYSPGYESGSRTILPVLRRLGVDRLHGVVLSHPHADHVGGVLSLIGSIPIDTLYEARFPTSSAIVAGYRVAARKKDIPIVSLEHGRVLEMGVTARGYVLNPIEPERYDDPNTASIVLKIVSGETSILFTGDADMQAEESIVEQYGPFLRSTVLKAGHHGSKTSSSIPFIEAVAPQHIVVSLAKINRYRHPHAEAVQRLRSSKANIHFTSLKGAVWLVSDGKQVREIDWR